MELLVASAIGILTAAGIYLVLRLRTFPVILGMSLLTYAVNVFLFASGRLTIGADDVRACKQPVVAFSAPIAAAILDLRRFLHAHMYNHYKVRRMTLKAQRIVEELFDGLVREPDCLPPAWRARAGAPGAPRTIEAIADYIAGMTDRYALDEHDRLFKLTARG